MQTRHGQQVCSVACTIARAEDKAAKKAQKVAQAERKADKIKREKLKTRQQWEKEAQAAFNAWVRARDMAAGLPCVSCGRHHQGQNHAGHYLSRGARPELRYTEENCWLQCAPCNTHLSGNVALYRIELVRRIGIDRVEWLEGPHDPLKLSIDDLKTIKATYREKANALAKQA